MGREEGEQAVSVASVDEPQNTAAPAVGEVKVDVAGGANAIQNVTAGNPGGQTYNVWAPLDPGYVPNALPLQAPAFKWDFPTVQSMPPWELADGGAFRLQVPGGWIYAVGAELVFVPRPPEVAPLSTANSPAGILQTCGACEKAFSHPTLVPFCGHFCAEKSLAKPRE